MTGTAGVELRSAQGHFSCRARDVSLAGCYVETRRALKEAPEGPQVEVVFQVPGQRERIRCAAEVVRQDAKSDGTIGLALRFQPVDWAAFLGLARLVAPQLALTAD